jgi:preprotein translocase subunit SecF
MLYTIYLSLFFFALFLMLVAGWLLIGSLIKIRNAMKDMGDGQIHTRNMVMHAFAFGLWLLTVFFAFFLTLFNKSFLFAMQFQAFAGILSTILLAVILWKLGSKEEEKEEEKGVEEFYPTILV